MRYEIHIYLGTACIAENSDYKYPVGEKHAILVYLRSSLYSEYNLTDAEEVVFNRGLNEIEFTKFGKLSPEKVNNDEKQEYYKNAMKTGSTLILYSDPI